MRRVMRASKAVPTRAEFEDLRLQYERVSVELDLLRKRIQDQAREIKTQFVRIAEMQAILDEERIANHRPSSPRPLFPAPHDH